MREGALLEAKKAKLKPPPLFKVILLNDDYTPMEFVVIVLQRFFSMTREKATQVMLKVHREGMAFAGSTPRMSPPRRSSKSSATHASTSTRYNASWRKRESEGAQAPR